MNLHYIRFFHKNQLLTAVTIGIPIVTAMPNYSLTHRSLFAFLVSQILCYNLDMKKNYYKKLAQLRYRYQILYLSNTKSIREITQIINYRLARTDLNCTLSKSTIAKIIQEQ